MYTYTLTTRKQQGTIYYIVKQYQNLDIENCPPIYRRCGIHTNYLTACEIAQCHDEQAINEMYVQTEEYKQCTGSTLECNHSQFKKELPVGNHWQHIYRHVIQGAFKIVSTINLRRLTQSTINIRQHRDS